jgi:hypothetical protein
VFRPGPGRHVTRFVNHFVTNCVNKKAVVGSLLCILPVSIERFTLPQTGLEFWMSVVVSPCSSAARCVCTNTDVSCSGSTGGAEGCSANAKQCHLRIYLCHFPVIVRLYFRPSHVDAVTLGQWHSIFRYFSYLLIEVNHVLSTQNFSQETPRGNSHVVDCVIGGRNI